MNEPVLLGIFVACHDALNFFLNAKVKYSGIFVYFFYPVFFLTFSLSSFPLSLSLLLHKGFILEDKENVFCNKWIIGRGKAIISYKKTVL